MLSSTQNPHRSWACCLWRRSALKYKQEGTGHHFKPKEILSNSPTPSNHVTSLGSPSRAFPQPQELPAIYKLLFQNNAKFSPGEHEKQFTMWCREVAGVKGDETSSKRQVTIFHNYKCSLYHGMVTRFSDFHITIQGTLKVQYCILYITTLL